MARRTAIFDDVSALDHAVASFLANAVGAAVREQGGCHLALPGGPFVRPIYTELAQFQLPWSEVTFYFTDERCVPPSHPASNFGEAVDKFLKNPRIDAFQFRRIEAELPDRERAAEEYERTLPEWFDVALLELGADGHVAALWPHSPALSERERLVVPVSAPTRPAQRITLAPRAFERVREAAIVAVGPDRSRHVARALAPEGTADATVAEEPVRLLPQAAWFLDRAAASELSAASAARPAR